MAGPVSGDAEAQCAGDTSSKRGGWITFPFMIATMLGMSIASFGWVMNLIVFLIEEFNIKNIAAAKISNIVNGCLNMLPVVVAILADSFLGNIVVISVSTFISLTGILLLTLIASLDLLKPRPCETGSILCQSPSELQLGILYTALEHLQPIAIFTSIIAFRGGTRFTLASAGANQYEKPKDQGSFFNWYFLTLYAGAITGATAIVYTQDNASWKLGFGLCAAANFASFIVSYAGRDSTRMRNPWEVLSKA
ncbi:Protein NRT1/ PTR FAMILY 2.3 [Raphanus sativus]|nr:Protein NRT1/ PTR FAMILY 2.3 [Raphanus sativus]